MTAQGEVCPWHLCGKMGDNLILPKIPRGTPVRAGGSAPSRFQPIAPFEPVVVDGHHQYSCEHGKHGAKDG